MSATIWRRSLVMAITVCSLLMFLPSTGRASTIVTGPVEQPGLQALFQRWVDESQAPSPRGYITIVFDQSSESYTHVNPWESHLIHWWAAGVGGEPEEQRLNFYVELGNVFQYTRIPAANQFLKTHFSKIFKPNHLAAWGLSNWGELRDWFGMSYASCASGIKIPNSEFWGFNYNPTPEQQLKACNLNIRVWRMRGLASALTTSEANEKFLPGASS